MATNPQNKGRQAAGLSAPKHARSRLLQAARALLSEGGVETATARAICQRADVRAPSLYHHFGDLRRLHSAAINAAFAEVMVEYRREALSAGTIAAIRQAWHAFLHFARTEPRLARLLVARSLDGEQPEALRLTLRRLRSDLSRLYRDQRLLVEADSAATLLWAAAVGAVSVTATGDDARPEAMTHLLDAVLVAVAGPGGD